MNNPWPHGGAVPSAPPNVPNYTLRSCGHQVVERDQEHYCDYVGADVELARCRPYAGTRRERDVHHSEELCFLNVHRVCEIWFEQIIDDLSRTIVALRVGVGARHHGLKLAGRLLSRCARSLNLVAATMGILQQMPPEDFAVFRSQLAPASGAESIQWRIIELRSGVRPETPYLVVRGVRYTYRAYLERIGRGAGEPRTKLWTAQMERAAAQPDLNTQVRRAAAEDGVSLTDASVVDAASAWSALVPSLTSYARAIDRVRRAHIELVRFQIGTSLGTFQGGAAEVVAPTRQHERVGHPQPPALLLLEETRGRLRLFPELWSLENNTDKGDERS